jgi:hypothetical protein
MLNDVMLMLTGVLMTDAMLMLTGVLLTDAMPNGAFH